MPRKFINTNLKTEKMHSINTMHSVQPCYDSCVPLSGFFSILQMAAASAPPTSGAQMNTQTLLNAAPPANTASPKLLAGLTLVPVK